MPPTLEPIRDEDVREFCEFLHENLNREIPADRWADAFRQDWGGPRPNNGFLIRDDLSVFLANCRDYFAFFLEEIGGVAMTPLEIRDHLQRVGVRVGGAGFAPVGS